MATGFLLCSSFGPGERPPTSLTVLFPGNASLALDWLELIESLPRDGVGYLLDRLPWLRTLQRTSFSENDPGRLCCRFHDTGDGPVNGSRGTSDRLVPLGRLSGHGCRTRIRARPPAPQDHPRCAIYKHAGHGGSRTVGVPLCYLLLDRFDNVRCLGALKARTPVPQIHVFSWNSRRSRTFLDGQAAIADVPRHDQVHGSARCRSQFHPGRCMGRHLGSCQPLNRPVPCRVPDDRFCTD